MLRASTPPAHAITTQAQDLSASINTFFPAAHACVEINQCVGCTAMTWPSSRCRVDGVEVDAAIQDERAARAP